MILRRVERQKRGDAEWKFFQMIGWKEVSGEKKLKLELGEEGERHHKM